MRAILLATAHVDAVVLARVCRGGCTLNAETALFDDEVILLAVWRVEVDINRNLELLVVCLVEQVDITNYAHHTLALCSKFLDIYICAFIIHDSILLEEDNHLIACLAVNDVV